MGRSQDAILTRIKGLQEDFLGFQREVLIGFLDYDHAKEFLKDEITAAEWDARLNDDAAIQAEMREYMAFAWEKVDNHRGISANRNIDKMTAFAWLLGRDDVIVALDAIPYPQYGAPKLKYLCDMFGFPMPDDEGLRRMAKGESCREICDEGCGR